MNRLHADSSLDEEYASAVVWEHIAVVRRFLAKSASGAALGLPDLTEAATAYYAAEAGAAEVIHSHQRLLLDTEIREAAVALDTTSVTISGSEEELAQVRALLASDTGD